MCNWAEKMGARVDFAVRGRFGINLHAADVTLACGDGCESPELGFPALVNSGFSKSAQNSFLGRSRVKPSPLRAATDAIHTPKRWVFRAL